ncbi:MAG TPA: hypothetical protein VKO18_15900 [Terriglobia bacterium]|nr:hypothetical protein [Terriglobia bacterium]
MKFSLILALMLYLASGSMVGQDASQGPAPDEPGLYCLTKGGIQPIVGRAVLFHRSGSRLAGAVTFGIVSGKVNIQIPGKHADIFLASSPVFYYRSSPEDPPGVLSLVLARLNVHGDRRQLEAKAAGLGRESKGISINSQIQTDIRAVSAKLFKVVPTGGLKSGEYAFYLRTNGASTQDAFIYDFSVE